MSKPRNTRAHAMGYALVIGTLATFVLLLVMSGTAYLIHVVLLSVPGWIVGAAFGLILMVIITWAFYAAARQEDDSTPVRHYTSTHAGETPADRARAEQSRMN
jgi:membrane protein implicated in regulation of membrane protease activity